MLKFLNRCVRFLVETLPILINAMIHDFKNNHLFVAWRAMESNESGPPKPKAPPPKPKGLPTECSAFDYFNYYNNSLCDYKDVCDRLLQSLNNFVLRPSKLFGRHRVIWTFSDILKLGHHLDKETVFRVKFESEEDTKLLFLDFSDFITLLESSRCENVNSLSCWQYHFSDIVHNISVIPSETLNYNKFSLVGVITSVEFDDVRSQCKCRKVPKVTNNHKIMYEKHIVEYY